MTRNSNSINSNRTKNPQQEQEKNGNILENHEYYNNYNTRAREDAETPIPGNEVMQRIAQAYRENISTTITKAAAGIIEQALTHGMEPNTIILAIEETGLASRPSPYYLRAVLRNWAEWGVICSRAREKSGITEARPWWK